MWSWRARPDRAIRRSAEDIGPQFGRIGLGIVLGKIRRRVHDVTDLGIDRFQILLAGLGFKEPAADLFDRILVMTDLFDLLAGAIFRRVRHGMATIAVVGARHVEPCDPKTADRHSGYMVGGTSPFGTRHPMPVYMAAGIAGLERLYINGGKRGFLIGMTPQDLIRVLKPVVLDIAV